MSSDLPPALVELLVGADRLRAEAQLRPLVESLQSEGIPPRAICKALAFVCLDMIFTEYDRWGTHRLWAKKFLGMVDKGVSVLVEDIDNAELQMEHRQRNREAGGSGTAFQ